MAIPKAIPTFFVLQIYDFITHLTRTSINVLISVHNSQEKILSTFAIVFYYFDIILSMICC
jgi:hypothetical protein